MLLRVMNEEQNIRSLLKLKHSPDWWDILSLMVDLLEVSMFGPFC